MLRRIPGPAGLGIAPPVDNANGEPAGGNDDAPNPSEACERASSWAAALSSMGVAVFDVANPPLQSSIRAAHRMPFQKLPKLLALVESLVPSASGNVFVRLQDPTGSINAAVSKAAVQQEPDITAGSTLMLKQVSIFAQHRSPCTLCITAENIVQVFPSAAPAIQPAAIQPLVAHPPTRAMPATSGASNVRVEPLAATDAADDIFAYLGPPSQIFTALLSQQRPQQQAGGARPVPQAPAPTAAPRGPCGSSATQPSAVIQASALAATADQGARRRGDDGTAERAAVSAMDEVEDDGAEDEDDDAPTFNLLACSGGGALRDGKRPRPDAPRAGEHDENVPPMGSSQLPAKQQPGRQHHHLSQHQSQQQPGGSRLKDLLLGQQDDIDLEES